MELLPDEERPVTVSRLSDLPVDNYWICLERSESPVFSEYDPKHLNRTYN